MDYGFHAPTMSWPINNSLMIEITETESEEEIERFIDAMIKIKSEINEIKYGAYVPKWDCYYKNPYSQENNPLKNAPHTALQAACDEWPHPYSRQQAAFPSEWVKTSKYWPPVSRIDNAHGDRNLVCTCPAVEEYEDR